MVKFLEHNMEGRELVARAVTIRSATFYIRINIYVINLHYVMLDVYPTLSLAKGNDHPSEY